MKLTIAASAVALAGSALGRTFTVYNACPFTIWPAVFTDLNVGSAVPGIETGWEAPAWSKRTFNVPDNWKAGRIWGRRNCNFATNPGPNSCKTGGCNGGLRCDSRTGTGVPPASVAEWTLSAGDGQDWYDVSLVDGYNLPMRITNNQGCPVAECAVDLGPNCPAALKGPYDSSGFPVGCKSACVANLDGNQANSKNCCSGQYSTPQTCPPSGVAYYSYFKNACPRSYVYAYDESSGTALFTCPTAKKADCILIDLPGAIPELRPKQDCLDDLLEHGSSLLDNFEDSGLVEELDQAINCWRSAILLVDDSDTERPKILNALCYAYLTRFERLGELQDLEHSIHSGAEALSLTLENHEEKAERLGNLGNAYLARYECLGELPDLNRAILCGEEAVLLAPQGHTSRAGQLNNLGVSYEIRFGRLGDLMDLNKAIDCGAEAVSLTLDDHLGKARRLSNLGISHRTRFELQGGLLDLEKAIEHGSKAISLAPDQDADKPGMLDSLGSTYVIRFKRLGDLRDLSESIKHGTQAILLTPDGHSARPGRISNLANSYLARFEHLGELPDLNKAIEYGEEAVSLTPMGYANGPAHLSNLGNAYRARYECQDELLDLSKSIKCGEQAVLHTPKDHADRPVRLGNLGISYQIRFGRVGELPDLNKAIDCGSEAVLLTPKDHADKPGRLGNLEISYQARFKRLGELLDLNMAIECGVKAVELLPKGHPDRPGQLSNLGCSYQARFEARGELPDLRGAIECGTEAVLLIPDGHTARPRMIDNLGNSYMTQFKQTGEILDLNKAIEYGTEAILLTPDDHPAKPSMLNNLGNYYLVRFVHSGELLDIQNAIHYGEEAVLFTPDGHAVRPSRLSNLGNSYLVQYGQSNTRYDLESAIRCYRDAAKSFAGSPSERLYACRRWAQLASHDTTSESPAYSAYQQAMLLLPQLIWIGTTIDRRYSLIAYLGDFATEAASFAIRINNLPLALEWLEAGRSIVWGQIAQLRTPFDLLYTYDSDLASRLKEVSQRLEQAGTRPSSEPFLRTNKKDLTKEANEHTQLALEWNLLLSKARFIPGFENFLCPPKSSMLLHAAKLHPIAVISIHQSRCDALIIQPNVNTIYHVPLANFSVESALAARKRLVSLVRHRRPGHLSKVGLLERSADSLWSGIIHPVLESLGYVNKLPVDQLPRITWCTTGLLSFLPLHAAECYDQAHSNTFDFVISSYTPTLSALLTAGSRDPGPYPNLGILAVGQEHTPGCDSLPSTVAELATIKKRAQTIPYLQLENDKATVDEVLSAMERFSWVHLACHGSQDTTDPTKSAFHLHDGNLTLATISKRSFRNKGFAFLSACQTATGDEDLPDEAVHLAAGMLMAGYPSVIGTMWSIADEDGPRVADKVYASLLKDGKMDHTKAARALHEAVAELRAMEDMPFERWAPFIHIGH